MVHPAGRFEDPPDVFFYKTINTPRHLPLGDGIALLQQPVRQGGLAVVNVGDDGEISDFG